MNEIVIVTGKIKDLDYVREYITSEDNKTKRDDITLIGVDSAIDALVKLSISPDLVIGDYDSLSEAGQYAIGLIDAAPCDDAIRFDLYEYQVVRLNPIKNDTDTEAALKHVMKYMKNHSKITILGATEGNRIDHLLGNIAILEFARTRGLSVKLVDAYNRISIIEGDYSINKSESFGKYISIVPHYGDLEDVSLRGFKYNITSTTISRNSTLGISNEIVDDVASIECQGVYLLIESRD